MHRLALVFVAVIAGCGGGEEEAVSAAWCTTTGRIVYLLDQHSTTLTGEELGEWEESTPESMRSTVADAANVLRRYPVDANAPALVEARQTIEAYAEDRCPQDWRGPYG